MITISKIDEAGRYAGETAQIEADAPCPTGWVRAAAPAAAPAGKQRVWSAGAWTLMPAQDMTPDLPVLRAAALADIEDQRWRATQSFTYDGVVAAADSALDAVIALVVGFEVAPPEDPDQPIAWKLARGEFRAWHIAQVIAYGVAIRAHIQACFDIEAGLTEAMATAATPAAIDALVETARISWPS